ncbi:MAG: M48 family metalloprotease [Planctomycetota bacterium]
MRRRAFPLLVLLAAACVQPTATDPVTGQAYYSPIGNDYASQDAYIRLNHITQRAMANDGGELPEPELKAACLVIFNRIASVVPPAHRRDFKYTLYLSASPQINAYTYGGGRVHCHLGLLARCNDAAEFATLVAHEIGHNSHDHVGQSLGRASIQSSIAGLGGIAGRPGRVLAGSFGGLVAGFVSPSYSKEQERQADDLAVDYALTAGYDAEGAARFFEGLERDFGRQSGFFQTHPSPRNRVRRIHQRIRANGGVPRDAIRSSPEFQSAVRRAREILVYYEDLYRALSGDDRKAVLRAADRGIAELPQHAQFHFWKGIALQDQGKQEASRDSLRNAERLDRTNLMIPLVHGLLEFQAENWAEAERSFDRLLSILDDMPGPLVLRGVCRLKQGKKEQAYGDFDSALADTPKRRQRALYAQIRKYAPEYVYDPDGSS